MCGRGKRDPGFELGVRKIIEVMSSRESNRHLSLLAVTAPKDED
jgi:hypothetical protein